MQKRRILLLTLTVLLLAATLASALLAGRLERKSQILKESDIKTGLQNNTVAFDESRNLVFMGRLCQPGDRLSRAQLPYGPSIPTARSSV